MSKQLRTFAHNWRRIKSDDYSTTKEYFLFCNHSLKLEDFSILTTSNNDFKATLMENLLINKDHPPSNKNMQSLLLELFDS